MQEMFICGTEKSISLTDKRMASCKSTCVIYEELRRRNAWDLQDYLLVLLITHIPEVKLSRRKVLSEVAPAPNGTYLKNSDPGFNF
jgi:hypothetical protein